MPKLPTQTPVKNDLPEEIPKTPVVPDESTIVTSQPEQSTIRKIIPNLTKTVEETPDPSKPIEKNPEVSQPKEEMPSDFNEENCVVVNGHKVEIKPTKLKYFRNKGASAYGIIKAVPLYELLTYDKGVIDPKRDADQLLYDFLVAVFDDSSFVAANYNEIDADTIDRIVKIFGRINHIDEKEEAARKNREAQAQAKR